MSPINLYFNFFFEIKYFKVVKKSIVVMNLIFFLVSFISKLNFKSVMYQVQLENVKSHVQINMGYICALGLGLQTLTYSFLLH